MARYALVDKNGLVANIVVWDGNSEEWTPPQGLTPVLDDPPSASPGFTYKDGKFIPPPEKMGTPEGEDPVPA